jgi:hypothetical protein
LAAVFEPGAQLCAALLVKRIQPVDHKHVVRRWKLTRQIMTGQAFCLDPHALQKTLRGQKRIAPGLGRPACLDLEALLLEVALEPDPERERQRQRQRAQQPGQEVDAPASHAAGADAAIAGCVSSSPVISAGLARRCA